MDSYNLNPDFTAKPGAPIDEPILLNSEKEGPAKNKR
jgi:hypothetical protein